MDDPSPPSSPKVDQGEHSRSSTSHAAENSKPHVLPEHQTLRNILDSVADEAQVLIHAKPTSMYSAGRTKREGKGRKSNRHSVYRGVSLNGKKWQVMIMGRKRKNYFGRFKCELEAAKFYDKLAIVTKGLSANTNFNYTKTEINEIMEEADHLSSLVF